MFSRLETIPAFDRHTRRQTHNDSIYRISMASHGKNPHLQHSLHKNKMILVVMGY